MEQGNPSEYFKLGSRREEQDQAREEREHEKQERQEHQSDEGGLPGNSTTAKELGGEDETPYWDEDDTSGESVEDDTSDESVESD
jgi:hypothetical protein